MQKWNRIGWQLVWIVFFASGELSAQNILLPSFRAVHQIKNSTTFHILDQPLSFQSEKWTTTQYRLLAPISTRFEMEAITENIAGSLFAFGKEQKFNSKDTLGLTQEELSWLKKQIGVSQKLLIANFNAFPLDAKKTNALQKGFLLDIEENPGKYFLPFNKEKIRAGLIWSDSTVQDSSIRTHQFVITKIVDQQVYISVISDWFIKTNVSQQGKTVMQQLKGIARSERIYHAGNGIMQSESMKVKLSGSSTMDKEVLPITIELSSNTTVSLH